MKFTEFINELFENLPYEIDALPCIDVAQKATELFCAGQMAIDDYAIEIRNFSLFKLFEAEVEATKQMIFAKSKAYGGDDPLSNFRNSLRLGIEPEIGIALRINDKLARLRNLTHKINCGEIYLIDAENDCYMDILGYSVLLSYLYESTLKIGDLVEKIKGYKFEGQIRSIFKNSKGDTRVVVEFHDDCDPTGMLHIFNLEQIRKL